MECRDKVMRQCSGCMFLKGYDYGRKVYYCDHEGRADDMGKLGAESLPDGCPEWCPLKNGVS